MKKNILILGVTASGKGTLGFGLAKEMGGEIISVDSMKVYKRMDIGTAKPSKERQQQIKYHLIDVVEPSESFSVAGYVDLFKKTVEDIGARNKTAIAVGGTALYIKTLLHGLFEGPSSDETVRNRLKAEENEKGLLFLYEKLQKIDPIACRKIHANDSKRIIRALEVFELTGKPISAFQSQWDDSSNSQSIVNEKSWTIIGLRREKEQESKRINLRVRLMMEAGLVDEVKRLLAEPKPLSQQAACAIGYAEIIDYLNGKNSLEEATELIKQNTRYLAKHQRTWFKRFANVSWLDIAEDETPESVFERAKKMIGE